MYCAEKFLYKNWNPDIYATGHDGTRISCHFDYLMITLENKFIIGQFPLKIHVSRIQIIEK